MKIVGINEEETEGGEESGGGVTETEIESGAETGGELAATGEFSIFTEFGDAARDFGGSIESEEIEVGATAGEIAGGFFEETTEEESTGELTTLLRIGVFDLAIISGFFNFASFSLIFFCSSFD